jgi:hypothetical protein
MPSAAVLGPRSIAIRHLKDDGLGFNARDSRCFPHGLNGARRLLSNPDFITVICKWLWAIPAESWCRPSCKRKSKNQTTV